MPGQLLRCLRGEVLERDGSRGKGVVARDSLLCWPDRDIGTAQLALLVLAHEHVQEVVEGSLAAVELGSCMEAVQALDEPLSHGDASWTVVGTWCIRLPRDAGSRSREGTYPIVPGIGPGPGRTAD